MLVSFLEKCLSWIFFTIWFSQHNLWWYAECAIRALQTGTQFMSVTICFLDSLWERCVGQLWVYLEGNAIFFSLEQEEPETPVNAGPSSNEDPSSSSSTQNSVAPGNIDDKSVLICWLYEKNSSNCFNNLVWQEQYKL